jgi:hypothetical protein
MTGRATPTALIKFPKSGRAIAWVGDLNVSLEISKPGTISFGCQSETSDSPSLNLLWMNIQDQLDWIEMRLCIEIGEHTR